MDATIFDLDGVLVDSEGWWDEIRREVVAGYGGRWRDEASTAVLGMSTAEWAHYLVADLGVRLTEEATAGAVIERMAARYDQGPPLLPHALEAVAAAATRGPVGIASSSPPSIIRAFLDATGLTGTVRAAVSSEETGAGKPDPAVYLVAAERIGVPAGRCLAVEDSTNGLKSALAAGMTVLAVPNPLFPPDPAVVATAAAVLGSLAEFPAQLDRW